MNAMMQDRSTETLAALGIEGYRIVRAFRAWLMADQKRSAAKTIKTTDQHGRKVRRFENPDETLKRLAKTFCLQKGLHPTMEAVTEFNPETQTEVPTGEKRLRRVDMLTVWHRKGVISDRGYDAAVALRNAYEATSRSPSAELGQERVDSSPKPDHAVTIQIDRLSRFHEINRLVAEGDREIVTRCVIDAGSPMGIKRYRGRGYAAGIKHLHDALARLADAMSG